MTTDFTRERHEDNKKVAVRTKERKEERFQYQNNSEEFDMQGNDQSHIREEDCISQQAFNTIPPSIELPTSILTNKGGKQTPTTLVLSFEGSKKQRTREIMDYEISYE